jgi:NTP pyrophosphatase (non-canonical NTP hydrolase)
MLNIKELAPRIFEGNKAKGFWPENPKDRNFGEAIMLVTDELSEAHEAWRCNKRVPGSVNLTMASLNFSVDVFKEYIKDTFEDELADACIRLMDIAQGYGYDINIISKMVFFRSSKVENIGERLLNEKETLFQIYWAYLSELSGDVEINIARSLGSICNICEELNIDLAKHIELKLQYNASRPHKHGKAY